MNNKDTKPEDIIFEATYLKNGKVDTVCFYNQSFQKIGEQLDIITDIFKSTIIKMERVTKPS